MLFCFFLDRWRIFILYTKYITNIKDKRKNSTKKVFQKKIDVFKSSELFCSIKMLYNLSCDADRKRIPITVG